MNKKAPAEIAGAFAFIAAGLTPNLSENRFALFGPMSFSVFHIASDWSENRFALFGPML